MKHAYIFIAIIGLFVPQTVSALNHLCDHWNVLLTNEGTLGPDEGEYWTSKYKIEGDTIINEKLYSRVLYADGFHKNEEDSWNWIYTGAIRETENAEIFFIPAGQTKEYLQYAFNAKEGDKFTDLYAMYDGTIVTALVKENSEKEIILDLYERVDGVDGIMWGNFVWIRGIGSLYSLFQPLPNGGVGGNITNSLLCAYDGETQIYISSLGETHGCTYWQKPKTENIEINNSTKPDGGFILREGQLYLMYDGRMFDIRGAEVK